MKRLLRVVLRTLAVGAAVAAALWAVRDRLLPPPAIPETPPPRFRGEVTPPAQPAAAPRSEEPAEAGGEDQTRDRAEGDTPVAESPTPDDLTVVDGIGPVYAARLSDAGLLGLAALAAADPEQVASAAGVSPSVAAGWIDQAKAIAAAR